MRLIDADPVIKHLDECEALAIKDGDSDYRIGISHALLVTQIQNTFPLCKECKHYEPEEKHCELVTFGPKYEEDSFCSFGERRTEE